MRTLFISLLATVIFTFCHAQNAELSLNLQKGEIYKQISKSNATVIQEVNGQELTIVMIIEGTMSFFVKEIDETGFLMDTKFEKLSMTMQMPQGSVDFSSEKNDENDVFSKILKAMINQSFEVMMTQTGKVREVKNVENLWDEAINQFGDLSEMQKQQIKAQIMKAYGADALKGSIEMVTAIYPDEPVKKGNKWAISTNLESGMSAKVNTEYEFLAVTSDYAMIKGISTIMTEDKDAYIESNGMPMKFDLAGSMISEIKVDKNTGWIVEANIKQELKGDTYIKDNPQVPGGMKIPMTMLNEMLITN